MSAHRPEPPPPGHPAYDAYVEQMESLAEDRARPEPLGPREAEAEARREADRYERFLTSTWP